MSEIDNKKEKFITFDNLCKLDGVAHLFTTKLGGHSEGIFATMNLSTSRGDDPKKVRMNYEEVAKELTRTSGHVFTLDDIVTSDQTHTTNVRVLTREDAGRGMTKERGFTDVDGFVTNEKGLVLATFYADCVPLYFVDPVKKAIGLSHSGWRGTASRMGEVTIKKMTEQYGTNPADLYTVVGPCICQECYEVSEDVALAFEETFAGKKEILEKIMYPTIPGKYQLNLKEANRQIMMEAGVPETHIFVSEHCTSCESDYLFSHRRTNGQRGNLGAFLALY